MNILFCRFWFCFGLLHLGSFILFILCNTFLGKVLLFFCWLFSYLVFWSFILYRIFFFAFLLRSRCIHQLIVFHRYRLLSAGVGIIISLDIRVFWFWWV
ncbi:hypothetical protein DYE48_10540 [Halobacillus trueperi]|uniref:Uncharacterized protein n=1 Tax=Halobacillus trueperi TaxID=156205 RepID=A0A3E0J8N2_9BACI|nr:hypothetical protein DYE48_10540 [Halobacillus trueperi]